MNSISQIKPSISFGSHGGHNFGAATLLPAYRAFRDQDRNNNAITRLFTGSATDCVEGIRVSASDYRDGRGAIACVTSASRRGFESHQFTAQTWQEAFKNAAAFRFDHIRLWGKLRG